MYSRTRNANSVRWQWLTIGIVMGFGCASVAFLVAVTAGLIAPSEDDQTVEGSLPEPEATVCGSMEMVCGTQVAEAISALPTSPAEPPPQAQATEAPAADDGDGGGGVDGGEPLQSEPSGGGGGGAVEAEPPTATMPPPTPAPPTNPPPTATTAPTEQAVDPRMANILTELMPVAGGENIEMGTNQTEAATAVQECQNAGGNCTIAMAEDSFPVHMVKLSSFQMERYEVTVAQYAAFLNTLGPGSHANGCGGARCAETQEEGGTSPIKFDGTTYSGLEIMLNRPVTNVTWFGAQTYCEVIGRRLPTEAEWERAARGPDPGSYIYPWGRTFDSALANTNASGIGGTAPVDGYPDGASPFGIEQMAGNVGEWVYDWYQIDFYSTEAATALDPTGPLTGTERVLRGGAWDQRPFFSRAVHRLSHAPGESYPNIGFRCVSDEGAPPTAVPQPVDAGAEAPAGEPASPPTVDPNLTPTAFPTLPPGGG